MKYQSVMYKGVLFCSLSICVMTACSASDSSNINPKREVIKPCPASPNCVSSLSLNDSKSYVAPLRLDMSVDKAKELIQAVILAMPNSKIITDDDNYQHYTFTSSWFKFIDDVELMYEEDGNITLINLRSASRTGYSDFGVNKKRVEQIRASLQ